MAHSFRTNEDNQRDSMEEKELYKSMKNNKEIKIPVYYYIDDDKTKVYDIESMQKDFDKEIDKLTKNKKYIRNNAFYGEKCLKK
jgi:hypothetical protein|tara:strand:- start:244 stop:495 length:252 start_codon:yes stop_codon:yes gene_type:complete